MIMIITIIYYIIIRIISYLYIYISTDACFADWAYLRPACSERAFAWPEASTAIR